jgi:hypothetical protein
MPRPTLQTAPQLILDPLQVARHARPGTFARSQPGIIPDSSAMSFGDQVT